MEIRPIRTEEDYEAACGRIDEIFHAEPGTPEDDELEILATLVEKYDDDHVHIRKPHPIEMIKMQMEALEVSPEDLAKHLGVSEGAVSDILDCKRALTLNDIRVLNKVLRINAETLLQEYRIAQPILHDDTRASMGA